MIPIFPKFKKLNLEDKDEFERLTVGLSHYTEFSFATSYAWDVMETLYISNLNDNLVVKFRDHHEKKDYFSIVGLKNIEESLIQVLEHSINAGAGDTLYFIAHEIVKHIKGLEFLEIIEDRDSRDYVVTLKEFVQLKGGKLADKRYKVNYFDKRHGAETEFKKLDLNDQKVIVDIRKVIQKWHPPKDKYFPMELLLELSALERMLRFHNEFKNIEVYGLYIQDKLEAFTVIQIASKTLAIGQFEKANKSYGGIFEYLNHKTMQSLHKEGFTHINIQQDLGYPGLRQSKSSYWPSTYQKKYTVRHKGVPVRHKKNYTLTAHTAM